MSILLPKPGNLLIRAYCTDCGELLMESNPLTKNQLITMWDRAVLQAVKIKCEKCGHKFPNFNIELHIYNRQLKAEYPPSKYIKPRHKEDPIELFKSISNQWLKEHKHVEKEAKSELIEEVKSNRKKASDDKERTNLGGD